MPSTPLLLILGAILTATGGVVGALATAYFTARFRRPMDASQIALQAAQREETVVKTLTTALDELRKHMVYLQEENDGYRTLIEQAKRTGVKAKVAAEEAIQLRDPEA